MKKRFGSNFYVFLFSLTYFVSYISRINYGAIISEMETATNISRSLLSMAITASFITYGTGQIVSGIIGDKISPKKLVGIGLIVTALMNLLIPVFKNPYVMLVFWGMNGFAQAFMWPPIVKLMTVILNEEQYKSAVVKVSWGSSFGTIVVYLLSPLLISWFGWKSVFVFSSLCAAAMFFVWNKLCYEPEQNEVKSKNVKEGTKSYKKLFSLTVLAVMFAIVLQGMLRDGVTTWMPSYISETYNLSNIISILTAVVLPIFSIISFKLASVIYSKYFKNPLLCGALLFGCGAVSALGLVLLSGSNAVFSIIFSAILTGMMHGVNVILVCMIPPFFKKYDIVSTASGVLNSCTYVGSAIFTYGVAVLSKNFGWGFTLKIWLVVAVLGTVVCLLCVKPWKKNFENLAQIDKT